MIIKHVRVSMGNEDIRGKLEDGTILSIKVTISPYRKITYWCNDRHVYPTGAKSPHAKYIPEYRQLTGEIRHAHI